MAKGGLIQIYHRGCSIGGCLYYLSIGIRLAFQPVNSWDAKERVAFGQLKFLFCSEIKPEEINQSSASKNLITFQDLCF